VARLGEELVPMRSSVLRLLLILAVASLFALPAAAQYDECKECRHGTASDGGYFQYCGNTPAGVGGTSDASSARSASFSTAEGQVLAVITSR